MRKNVLFIAKFDTVLKGMNSILAKSFNMQMCPPEPALLEKMLGVMEIDLVLFYISGLSEKLLANLSGKLIVECPQTPVVVFGTAEECSNYDKTCSVSADIYMYRPLTAQDITKSICELLEVEPEIELEVRPEEQPETKPETQPETKSEVQKTEIKKNMSLADFASTLETDKRRCILLVDDDGRILRAMKMLLENNYRINLANSGMSALESIGRERPDAVLLDYEMPMFNGKQTLEMIRKNAGTKNLPVFFLTGVSDKERVKDVIHLRPQGYLLKSSEQSVIIETLEKFFDSLEE